MADSSLTDLKLICSEEDSHEQLAKAKENQFNTVSFFVFGFVIYASFFVGVSAAEDILEGTAIPTALVLVALFGPYFLFTSALPYFLEELNQLATTLATSIFLSSGLLLAALGQEIPYKLCGICFLSIGNAAGDVGYLSLTAMYEEVTVKAYASGSGAAIAAVAFYYTGMTTWLCVPPSTTLMTMLFLPPLLIIFHLSMKKKQGCQTERPGQDGTTQYSLLDEGNSKSAQNDQDILTLSEKCEAIAENAALGLSFFLGYVGEFLLLSGVVTTLAFPSAPFGPRETYQYYVFVFVIGEVIGRSYGLALTCLKIHLPSVTRHTWIFTLFIAASLLFMFLAAWFRFLDNVWTVLIVVHFVGLNAGALYVNTFTACGLGSSTRDKKFSRAFLTAAMGGGALLASLLGLFVEEELKQRCYEISHQPEFCLTRAQQGWDASSCSRKGN